MKELVRVPLLAGAMACLAATPATAAASAGNGKAKASTIKLHSGTLTLTFTPKVYGILNGTSRTGAFPTTNAVLLVAPATAPASGSFAFPIASGKLNSKSFAGRVGTKGGLNFTSTTMNPLFTGTSQFELIRFALHLGGSQPQLSATFVGQNTATEPIAVLVTKRLKHSKHGRRIKLTNISLELTTSGVSVFQTYNLKAGQTIGTVAVAGTS